MWYSRDRDAFIAADTEGRDDQLEQAEFQAVVKEILGLGKDDAAKLMKQWDTDANKAVDPIEWCTFMATLRAEKAYQQEKVHAMLCCYVITKVSCVLQHLCKHLDEMIDDLVPGGLCCFYFCGCAAWLMIASHPTPDVVHMQILEFWVFVMHPVYLLVLHSCLHEQDRRHIEK